jgi:hypothetical protein
VRKARIDYALDLIMGMPFLASTISGEHVQPGGRSSVDPSSREHQAWSGHHGNAGTYHIVVEHTGDQADVSYYLLAVDGNGVSLVPQATVPALENVSATQSEKIQPRVTPSGDQAGKLVFQWPRETGYPSWSPDGEQTVFRVAEMKCVCPRLNRERGVREAEHGQ